MPAGRPDEETLRQRLVEVARNRVTTADGQLCGSGWDAIAWGRHAIGRISLSEHRQGRPLLCAVVVNKQTGRPGAGLYEGVGLEHDAGKTDCRCGQRLVLPGEDEVAFVSRQLALLYHYWAGPAEDVGDAYRGPEPPSGSRSRDPFEVDPGLLDRANAAHVSTQRAVADHLRALGIEPRSPLRENPDDDLAWVVNGTVYVCEVKSLTARNERQQLRLGLGQVLHYRHLLEGGIAP